MATALTPLGTTHGYYAGVNSLDTSGYIATIPAYQQVFFADGRAYDNHGYNKLNLIGTKITAVASGAFQVGEVVTQATSGATGIYMECIDIKLTGTPSGTFQIGELVTQANSGAKGYVAAISASAIYVFPLTYTLSTPALFDATNVVTGATSAKTITPSVVSAWATTAVPPLASYGSVGTLHFIYRTTTTEFVTGQTITGSTTAKTLTSVTAVTAPPHWLPWIPLAGLFPDGGSNIGTMCFGRIFLNSMLNPHQWACSRIFNPLDWNQGVTDVGSATSSQNAKAGEVGDALVSYISYKDIYQIWGGANEVWLLQGDPLMGGVNRCLSKSTGIFSPTSYCWDDKNNLYFLGSDGVYALSSDAIVSAAPPTNITKERVPQLVTSLGLNRRTDRVAMGYDKKRYGIKISVTQMDGQWATGWWLDLRTGGIFPEKNTLLQDAASMHYFDAYDSASRGLLLGCYDGFIRVEDEAEKADVDASDVDCAIEAHVAIGPIVATGEPREQAGITETSLVLGSESDGITVEYHRAASADEVVNNVIIEETPFLTKTLTGDGLKSSIIDRVSGRAVAVVLRNEVVDETFSVESVNLSLSTEGRKKG